jgi:hypothetical protein
MASILREVVGLTPEGTDEMNKGSRATTPTVLATALLLLATGCGGAATDITSPGAQGTAAPPIPVGGQPPASTPTPQATPPAGMPQPVAEFDILAVHDPMIEDLLALTILVPPGWTAQGGIWWEPNLHPLAAAVMTISDPSGWYALETYFPTRFSWIDVPAQQNPGANWLGSIMAAPRSASQALQDFVLPAVRPNAQIVGTVPIDTSGLPGATEGVRVRVRYGDIEEDFVAITDYFSDSSTGPTFTQWGFQMLYSVRAPVGELDAALPTLDTIVASIEMDPLWYSNYLTVMDLFMARGDESIRLAGELSAYLTRTYAEINRIHMEVWENQQASYDRIHENFVDYIMETQRVNPTGGGGNRRVPSGVACQRPDGGITVLPDGATCPPGWTFLPPVG